MSHSCKVDGDKVVNFRRAAFLSAEFPAVPQMLNGKASLAEGAAVVLFGEQCFFNGIYDRSRA